MNKYVQWGYVSRDASLIIEKSSLTLPNDRRSISRNEASLNTLVHDVVNLIYYEHWTDKWKYFYVYWYA